MRDSGLGQMLSFYIVRGHTLDHLLSLSYVDKLAYKEAMEYAIEMENERYNAMFGK